MKSKLRPDRQEAFADWNQSEFENASAQAAFADPILPIAANQSHAISNGEHGPGNAVTFRPLEIQPTTASMAQVVTSIQGASSVVQQSALPPGWLIVPVSVGGITINLKFDPAAAAAPASFRAGVEQAAMLLAGAITD